jgi:hypothetical protein
VWGKRWTKRTAAGYLFKDAVEEEMQKLLETSDYTNMTAYQPALTKVWDGLSKEEQELCDQEAKRWNSGD